MRAGIGRRRGTIVKSRSCIQKYRLKIKIQIQIQIQNYIQPQTQIQTHGHAVQEEITIDTDSYSRDDRCLLPKRISV